MLTETIALTTDLEQAYFQYAVETITDRALPRVEDGLKPVQRRILYTMHEMGLYHDKPHRKSARVVGECFVKDTLVATPQGLVPIQDITHGDQVFTENGQRQVIELYKMPPQPLCQIELENGLSNVATPTQLFRVLAPDLSYAWKEARALSPGDWIVLRAAFPSLTAPSLLPPYQGQEKTFNTRLAYLLGLLMSDGWVAREPSRWRLGFYSAERDVMERVVQYLYEEFEYEATIETKAYECRHVAGGSVTHYGYIVRINRDRLNTYFVETFGLTDLAASNKFIPQVVLRSSLPVVFAFLSGLIDGDGSIHREHAMIHYGSISAGLIDDLQILLHHLSIPSRRYVKSCDHTHRQPFYWLEINGTAAQRFARCLDLAHPVRRQLLNELQHRQTKQLQLDQIPYASAILFDELSRHHLGSGWYQEPTGRKFRQGIVYPGGSKIRYGSDLRNKPLYRQQLADWGIASKLARIGSPYAERVAHFLADQISFARVARVMPHEAEETYDIQVADSPMFVANGMVVHNCLGKYHPHGDQSVYLALVRMGQDFAMRAPLIDGQGNFGSVDGDAPAAMRYTEARLAEVAGFMLQDIEQDTVDMVDNFDGSLQEPVILPAAFPNLLVNGATGIAVGMATNIPPHNLGEVCDAVIHVAQNWRTRAKITVDDLIRLVPGPDFPTGGVVYRYRPGPDGEPVDTIRAAYETGRGGIVTQARVDMEDIGGGKVNIVVTELPYAVLKSTVLERIAREVREGKISGVTDLRDESDHEGMRVIIEVSRVAEAREVLESVLSHSQLRETFGVNALALVAERTNGETIVRPQRLSLLDMLVYFIEHRLNVITRRSRHELARREARLHIVQGLLKALDVIDQVIDTIRRSRTAETAEENLIKKFKFTPAQAQAILAMQLRRLAALERRKLADEEKELEARIKYLKELLRSEKRRLEVVVEETRAIKARFATSRKTVILTEDKPGEVIVTEAELAMPTGPQVIAVTTLGVQRQDARQFSYRAKPGVTSRAVEAHRFHIRAEPTDTVILVSNRGRAWWGGVGRLPRAATFGELGLAKDEQVVGGGVLTPGSLLVIGTRQGRVKRVKAEDARVGAEASWSTIVGLDDKDDGVLFAGVGGEEAQVLFFTGERVNRFAASEVNPQATPSARGVAGVKVAGKDRLLGGAVVPGPQAAVGIVVVSQAGFVKRVPLAEFPVQGRGGQGVQVTQGSKAGPTIAAGAGPLDGTVDLLARDGKRQRLDEVPVLNRTRLGKKLVELEDVAEVAVL